MEVHIKRSTGIFGGLSKLKVKINGKEKSQLKNNDKVKVILPESPAELTVHQSFFRSNALKVNDGDTVEATQNQLSFLVFLISLVVLFLGGVTNTLLLTVFGMVGLLSIVLFLSKKWFVLQKK